ncbi:TIM barrel protein [Dysgonomonas reticulitermitis]
MKNRLSIIIIFLFCFAAHISGQNNIKVSLVKWSFRTQTELLCQMAKGNHVAALEMVDTLKWDIVLKSGLQIAMADGADLGIERGFCDKRWHKELIDRYTCLLPKLQEKGIKQIVCYSGINTDLNDDEALDVCVQVMKPILEVAEKNGITLSMELISTQDTDEIFTKQRFKYYQCDNMEWAVSLCKKLNSPNFKLLYDVWHMQDMGRDIFDDIKKYHPYISHYHIAAYPKRNILNKEDKFDYNKLVNEIQKTGYKGYIGLELDRVELDLEKIIKQSMNILKDK